MGYQVTVNEEALEHGAIASMGYSMLSKEKLLAMKSETQMNLQNYRQQYSQYKNQEQALKPQANRAQFDLNNAEKNLNSALERYNSAKAAYTSFKSKVDLMRNSTHNLLKNYNSARKNAIKYKALVDRDAQKLADIQTALNKKG